MDGTFILDLRSVLEIPGLPDHSKGKGHRLEGDENKVVVTVVWTQEQEEVGTTEK